MHKEILSPEQTVLLPIVKLFSKDFGLVGGTAIALHLGHRESIDFDLFTMKEFGNQSIRNKIIPHAPIDAVLRDEMGQFTVVVNGVRLTFFQYPYPITFSVSLNDVVKIPDLLTLAAMKAFALGRRAKWKDYMDLFFILKEHNSVTEIAEKSIQIFGAEFNEKNFRAQLAYVEDVDYSERVMFKEGFAVADEVVKKALVEFSLE